MRTHYIRENLWTPAWESRPFLPHHGAEAGGLSNSAAAELIEIWNIQAAIESPYGAHYRYSLEHPLDRPEGNTADFPEPTTQHLLTSSLVLLIATFTLIL